MGSEPDDEQHSLTEYGVTSQSADSQNQGNTDQEWIASDGDGWQCRVCGHTSTDKAIIENCHPKRRLIRERNAAVTEPTPPHTGPVIPPQLGDTAISLFNDVKSIVESHDGTGSEVLPRVGDRIADAYSSNTAQSALTLFTDFVWLRSCHLLPDYPAFETDPISSNSP